MQRMVGLVEKFRGRLPPEVVARFQAKIHEAMERGGASAAASGNIDALFSSMLGGSASAPTSAAAPPAGAGASGTTGTMPAPFDPPEAPSASHGRHSRRDDQIEHISMPSSAAETVNVPAPYDADAGSGLLERLGLRGKSLLVLLLVLLAIAMGIAFLLRRHG